MGSKCVSAISWILIAVATASLALCLHMCYGLDAHQGRVQRAYGDRAFSLRAVSALTGSLYRFDQQDVEFIQDQLIDRGVVVAGLGSSYTDLHRVDEVALSSSAGYGYLLFETCGDTSLIDGMKSVSGFLLAYYPELQIDLYSEYERFVAQSFTTRLTLRFAIAAALIGYVIAGVLVYASLSQQVSSSWGEIRVRIIAGSPHVHVAALLVGRAVVKGVFAGVAGCLLCLAVSVAGVSLPEVPAESAVAVGPITVSLTIALLTVIAAVLGPARRVCTMDSLIYPQD